MTGPVLYSVIIPCYNSSSKLADIIDRINTVFTIEVKEDFEIILIDDASPNPKTWDIIREIAISKPYITAVKLTRNFGQHSALLCGLKYAKGSHAITMDDDGQHLPEELPRMIEKAEAYDIVLGRFIHKKHSLVRQLYSNIVREAMSLFVKKPRGICHSALRVVNRSVIDGMLSFRTPFPYFDAIMYYISRNVIDVPVHHGSRIEGKSTYDLSKLFRLFLNLLINNSSFLLRLVGYGGLTIALLSFFAGIYLIINWAFGNVPQGWTSIMIATCFFGGCILLSLGIIGEYLWRIICGLDERPAYAVREVISHKIIHQVQK